MDFDWDVPLGAPPEIVTVARNAHGFQNVDKFLLRDLWSLHLYGYHASLVIEGRTMPIRPGYASVTPPGVITEYRYVGLSVHLFAHFRLPSNAQTVKIPAMQDLASNYEPMYQDLFSVRGRTDGFAQARVWDMLWTLSSRQQDGSTELQKHHAVVAVEDLIDQNLQSDLSVAYLASTVSVSYGYLSQLFAKYHDCTVSQFLTRRRVERAVHLLTHSTLPIKVIASSVGIPDIHYFNKVIRKATGISPTELRNTSVR